MKKIITIGCMLSMLTALGQQPKSFKGRKVTVFTTADTAQWKMAKTATLDFVPAAQPIERELSIFVEPDKTFQTFIGIGGAITDASAETFAKLSKEKQREFLDAYYDKTKGIGYSLMRTSIHSSDFASGSYTYIKEGDAQLKTFSIDHDRTYRLPMIKQALATSGKIPVFVSAWSPPAFMKDNNNLLRGGKLKPEFRQAWADYFIKFIQAYEKEGIPIWGATVQNEPMAIQTWESCIFTAEDERDFLKKYLGPTFRKAGFQDKKLIVWDHNRDLMTHRADVIFSDPEASQYAWGLGFHWYETWTGAAPAFDNVARVHEAYPDKALMFTEGCIERFDPARYQYWPNAERYGSQMIHDFNNGTVAWTDWNILLDEKGGPNHVGNFCFSPVHADTKTGQLIYTPSFYYIGHFSKFIRPNAKRVGTSVSRSPLLSTSFVNVDGQMVTVVMNQGDTSLHYNLVVDGFKTAVSIPAHAIQTLTY